MNHIIYEEVDSAPIEIESGVPFKRFVSYEFDESFAAPMWNEKLSSFRFRAGGRLKLPDEK